MKVYSVFDKEFAAYGKVITGIEQAETIAFGDGANDIEMLQWAGIGIAMGNAADTVKDAADMVTTDVDNEGIEHAVNEILAL